MIVNKKQNVISSCRTFGIFHLVYIGGNRQFVINFNMSKISFKIFFFHKNQCNRYALSGYSYII